jgi:hypothetical protein
MAMKKKPAAKTSGKRVVPSDDDDDDDEIVEELGDDENCQTQDRPGAFPPPPAGQHWPYPDYTQRYLRKAAK